MFLRLGIRLLTEREGTLLRVAGRNFNSISRATLLCIKGRISPWERHDAALRDAPLREERIKGCPLAMSGLTERLRGLGARPSVRSKRKAAECGPARPSVSAPSWVPRGGNRSGT